MNGRSVGGTEGGRPGELGEALDVDLSGVAYGAYEGQPVMIAETMRFVTDDRMQFVYEGTLELVADLMEEYVGQEVTVGGEVDDVLEPGVFRLVSDGLLDEDAVLVLGVEGDPQPMELSEGDSLRVTGELRRFDLAGIEDEFELDLEDAQYEGVEGEAVIVAASIEVSPSD